MAKIGKAKINKIIKAGGSSPELISVAVGDETFDIEVFRHIPHEDFCKAAREYAEMLFARNEETGEDVYAPYLESFCDAYITLKYFTNLDVGTDIKLVWDFSGTGHMEKINDIVCPALYRISNAAHEMAEIRRADSDGLAKLWTLLEDVIAQVRAQVSTDEFREAMETLSASADNLIEFPRS